MAGWAPVVSLRGGAVLSSLARRTSVFWIARTECLFFCHCRGSADSHFSIIFRPFPDHPLGRIIFHHCRYFGRRMRFSVYTAGALAKLLVYALPEFPGVLARPSRGDGN